MTMRYRQAYPKTHESLDVRDWNNNMQEIASEFNGFMDRDNVPENVIDLSMTKLYTFNKVHSDAFDDLSGTDVALSAATTGWQTSDGTDRIGRIDIVAPCDELLICEFSCWVETGSGTTHDFVRFRISVDGETVAINGFSPVTSLSKHALFIAGAAPVLAGPHVIRAEAQVGLVDISVDSRNFEIQTRATVGLAVDVSARELVVIERRR